MKVEEAKILLGFSPASTPDPSQVKAAYRKKVWESHPDLFPDDQKPFAESKFKSVMLRFNDILEQVRIQGSLRQEFQRHRFAKRGNPWLIGAPFLLIVLGTVGLGGIKASRAYNLQKQSFPSHNPFLP